MQQSYECNLALWILLIVLKIWISLAIVYISLREIEKAYGQLLSTAIGA